MRAVIRDPSVTRPIRTSMVIDVTSPVVHVRWHVLVEDSANEHIYHNEVRPERGAEVRMPCLALGSGSGTLLLHRVDGVDVWTGPV